MPVVAIGVSKCPLHTFPAQAVLDVPIIGYVDVVVVTDKLMMVDRVVQGDGSDCEKKSQEKLPYGW